MIRHKEKDYPQKTKFQYHLHDEPYMPQLELSGCLDEHNFPELNYNVKNHLKLSDLDCLKRGKWLTDAIVDTYLKFLVENSPHKSFGYTNSYFFSKLDSGKKAEAAKWEGIPDFLNEKFRFFFIPYSRRSHWSLVLINVPKRIVHHMDSMGKSGNYFFKLFNDFLKENGKPKFEVQNSLTGRQRNSSDCGVFILKYAEKILNCEGKTLDKVAQRDVTLFRSVILSDLENLIGVNV